MGLRQRFWRDERGTSFEGIALSVAIVAVAFVASADMLDYLTKPHHDQIQFAAAPQPTAPHPVGAQPPPAMLARDNGLDYTPTASLPKLISRSVLDPCTGASH